MPRTKLVLVGLLAASLTACSDPEKEANVLFVDAANQIQAAANFDTLAKFKAYSEARAKLDSLNTESFKGTQASLKVASQEKVGGLTSTEINEQLAKLEASNAVCGAVRSDDCAEDIIAGAADELIDQIKGREPQELTKIVARLELAGKTAQAKSIINKFAKAIGRPELVSTAREAYPNFLSAALADFVAADTDEDLIALYKSALAVEGVSWDVDARLRLRDTLLSSIELASTPRFALYLVENEADKKQQQDIADRALRADWDDDGKQIPLEILVKLVGYASRDKKMEHLAKIASFGKAAADEVFKLVKDDTERQAFYQALFSSGIWRWNAADRLDLLKKMPPEALRASPGLVINIALENTERRAEVSPFLDVIADAPETKHDIMILYPAVKGFLQGTGDLTEIVRWAEQEAWTDSLSNNSHRLCGLAPRILARAGKSALLPSLVDACLPQYKLDGDKSASAWAALRDLGSAAGYSKEEDMAAALAKIETLPSYQKNGDMIVSSLIFGKMPDLALEVARKLRDTGDEKLGRAYSHLLKTAISTEGGNPQTIWNAIKSRAIRLESSWIVPPDALSKQGSEFLEKVIAEDADVVSFQVVNAIKRWPDRPSSNGFKLLSKDRLVALAKNIKDRELKAAALDVLALRVRQGDPAELIDAAWNLQDDKVGAAMRITAIGVATGLRVEAQPN